MDKTDFTMSRRKMLSALGTAALCTMTGGTGYWVGKAEASPLDAAGNTATVANPMREDVNVLTFGAKGDGLADDTNALQAAIHEAVKSSRSVYLPRGRYRTSRPLILPGIDRPNTAGTAGSGFRIIGSGMYDSGIVYTGKDYAIYSEQELAETMLFQDFYINHSQGGGICLPQGAHQMFERFFSSSCGEGKYGLYIQGSRTLNTDKGHGSYVISLRNCRFWSETGYKGTGVRLENVLLCTVIDSCFFSTLRGNRSHLELVACNSVHITASAFERLDDPLGKAPLIRLDGSFGVSIEECHAEAFYDAFVGVYNGASNVSIDGCRLDHYAIVPHNALRGLIVYVDDKSTASKRVVVGSRNMHIQSNHPDTVHGPIVYDPIGCVTIKGFRDSTPYANTFQWTERRTVPRLGETGGNLLLNPALYSDTSSGLPLQVTTNHAALSFQQLAPSGCRITQTDKGTGPYTISLKAGETLNKYKDYTLFVIGKNNKGSAFPMFVEMDGYRLPDILFWPTGKEQAALAISVPARQTRNIQLMAYTDFVLDISSIYLVPHQTSEVPYGTESLSASKLHLGREVRYGASQPKEPGMAGDIVFNANPAGGGHAGWIYTAGGWKKWGAIET